MCSSKLLVREKDWGGGSKDRATERERENTIWCRNGEDRLSGSFRQETLLIL